MPTEFITQPYQPRIKIVRHNGVVVGKVKRSYEHGDKWIAYKPGAQIALCWKAGETLMAREFDTKEDAAAVLINDAPTAYDRAMEREHAR